MRRFEERSTTFLFEDEDAPEVWTTWGGLKRRVRFQAQYVLIDWKREGLGEFFLWRVWTSGPRVHAQSIASISATFFDHGVLKQEMPSWLTGFVELTNPNEHRVVYT